MEIPNQWYDDSDEGSENVFQKAILELSGKIIKGHMSYMGNGKIGKTEKVDDYSTLRECSGVGEMKNKQCGASLTMSGVVTQVIPTETKGTLKPLRNNGDRA